MDTRLNVTNSLLQGLYCLKDIDTPNTIPGPDEIPFMNRDAAENLIQTMNKAFEKILLMQINDLMFEDLYRSGYILTLNKYGSLLYTQLNDVISQHLTSIVLPVIITNMNKNFLEVLALSWAQHYESMRLISHVLIYIDRVFVAKNCLTNVFKLGLELFRNTIVYHSEVQNYLTENLIHLVKLGRNGSYMNSIILRSVTSMLLDLGNDSRVVYEQIFEQPFLCESARYFIAQSAQFLSKNDAAFYLNQVESLMEEETARSEQCYDSQTTEKLIKLAEEQLLKMHLKEVIEMNNSGLVYMIEHQKTEDLFRMYNLFRRVSEGLDTMFSYTSFYLRQKGHQVLNDVEAKGTATTDFIQNLLLLKDQFASYLTSSFSNDKIFMRQLAADFEYILNIDPKLPEYLSLFFDDRLRKAAKGITQDERNTILDRTVVLFRFLQDKDLFEQYYKQHLAKRLLSGKFVNEEMEKGLVIKFKEECGFHYTRKLEGMFHDIATSTGETEEFKHFLTESEESTEGVDINLKVLTAVYWPSHVIPPPCNLPCAPLAAFDAFKKFYLAKHSGRQLTLLPQLGTAELETYVVPREVCNEKQYYHSAQTQPCGEVRSYTLVVSSYQMCVLMLFNERSKWSLQELHGQTNISLKDLQRALQALSMGKSSQKVLLKQPDSRTVETTDIFLINTTFTANKNKVKIPLVQVKYDTEFEGQDTMKRVNNDRHSEVEAAIIRVMKAKRVISHDVLMNEVVNLLSQRFRPKREVVKTRIEMLIEREYIARTPSDRRVYEYIPS